MAHLPYHNFPFPKAKKAAQAHDPARSGFAALCRKSLHRNPFSLQG